MSRMNRLISFFSRPLPQNDNGNWLQAGLIAGAIVFFLLFFLRPFGLGQFEGNIFFVALCFSLLAVAVTWCYGACVFRPWVRRVKTWRVWHECVAILLLLCCISMSNSVVNTLLFHNSLSPQLVLAYLYVTLLFGIPITLTIVALEYQRRLRTRLAELLPKDTDAQAEETVTFHDTSVRGNDLTLPLSDFLYAEAQKNCVDIYFLREGHVEHQQLRTTLTSVLADANEKSIFQCHRSFIVNLSNISSAHGNSNGYQLTVGDEHHTVPVSRSYVPKLRSFVG